MENHSASDPSEASEGGSDSNVGTSSHNSSQEQPTLVATVTTDTTSEADLEGAFSITEEVARIKDWMTNLVSHPTILNWSQKNRDHLTNIQLPKLAKIVSKVEKHAAWRTSLDSKMDDAIKRLEVIENRMQADVRPEPSSVPTYAEQTRKVPRKDEKSITQKVIPPPKPKIKPPNLRPAPKKNIVIISSNQQIGGEAIKGKLLDAIDPGKERWQVKRLGLTRSNKVFLEVSTADVKNSIMNNTKLIACGLIAEEPKPRRPRLLIYNVPAGNKPGIVEDAIVAERDSATRNKIREQNFPDLKEEEWNNSFKLLFKLGKNLKEREHWVVETTQEMQTQIQGLGRLYVGYNSCRVKEFVQMDRCSKCLGSGPRRASCPRELDTCTFCSEEGHVREDCASRKSGAKPRCAVCRRSGEPFDHHVYTSKCSVKRGGKASNTSNAPKS